MLCPSAISMVNQPSPSTTQHSGTDSYRSFNCPESYSRSQSSLSSRSAGLSDPKCCFLRRNYLLPVKSPSSAAQ
jgi:hypothetical protein